MVDLNARKVPVFPGINDFPRVPTSTVKGNGADIVSRFNGLIDDIQTEFDSLNEISASPILTEDITWYVDSNSGNDGNDGLTAATAFETLQLACSTAVKYNNPGNYARNIMLQPGSYSGWGIPSYFSSDGSDYINIIGGGVNRSEVHLSGFLVSGLGVYKLDLLTLDEHVFDGYCIRADNARVKIGSVDFGAASGDHIVGVNRSSIEVEGDYRITGSASRNHLRLDNFSSFDMAYNYIGTRTIYLPGGSISFQSFVDLKRSSYFHAHNTNFSGTATGQRYRAVGNCVIDTNTGDADKLPGDLAGILGKNSYYF